MCWWIKLVLAATLLVSLASAGDTPKAPAPAMKEITMDMVAKIKVGSATMTQVSELWGTPWRVINDLDCHVEDNQGETWEYIGRDEDGSAKIINVQFDHAGIARFIAQNGSKGQVVVLASAPASHHNHEH